MNVHVSTPIVFRIQKKMFPLPSLSKQKEYLNHHLQNGFLDWNDYWIKRSKNMNPNLDCCFNSFHCSFVKCSSRDVYYLEEKTTHYMLGITPMMRVSMMMRSWSWSRTRSRTMMSTHKKLCDFLQDGKHFIYNHYNRFFCLFLKSFVTDTLLLL